MRKSNLSCFTDCTKHASACALIHRQQTIYWIFTHTKLSSNYRHKPIVTYWALKKCQALLTTKPCNYYFFFLLLGREDSAEILASVLQEEKKFKVLIRCYIQYIQLAFSCVMEKLLIFHIYEIQSGVMRSSCISDKAGHT